MKGSITRRLLISSSLVVFAFLGIAGLSLDTAYRDSNQLALEERLQAHIYTLLSAANDDELGRMRLPEALSAPNFNQPDSGLYAEVSGEKGSYRWRSASLLGRNINLSQHAAVGTSRHRAFEGLAILDQGIGWEDLNGNSVDYVFSVAVDLSPLTAQQQTFRQTLWGWLGGSGLLLLITQFLLMRWGLRPLREIAQRLRQVQNGEIDHVQGPVPKELSPLTDNLNALIQHDRNRQKRTRNSLADLAHSLKTPLAVLRGAPIQDTPPELAQMILTQTSRIDEIVSYQRQRAAVAGNSALLKPIAIAPLIRRIGDSLLKVHHQRRITFTIEIADDFQLRIDQGDLFELFGNLLENAFKHCRQQVIVRLAPDSASQICIEDDGDGIPADQIERVLLRGERADQRHPGQGIGLAVATEIVKQYDAGLQIDRSPLGGTRITIGLK